MRRDGWAIPLSMHGTQSGAERTGRQLAQRQRAWFFVHGLEGRLIRSESYVPGSP